jgi:hypothetical protein
MLRGAKLADTTPTKFELVVNMKSTKALSISIPEWSAPGPSITYEPQGLSVEGNVYEV